MPRALLAAAAALLLPALLLGGGTSEGRLFWIGCFALALVGVLLAAALLGVLPVPRLDRYGLVFTGALTAFVLWNGASIAWSIVPDRSWSYLNRGLVYLAFALVGLLLGGVLPRAPRALAGTLAVLLALVLGWALLTRAVPGLFPDGVRNARLRAPIGYWNALALLADVALVLALWLGSSARRLAGTLLAYGALVSLLLTYSRGGVAVAVVVVCCWLAAGHGRFAAMVSLALAAPVALAVAGLAFALPGLGERQSHDVRTRDGAIFAAALVLGGLLVWAGARAARRLEETAEGRRRLSLAAPLTLAAVAILCSSALALRAGGPGAWWREFTNPGQIGQGSGRLTSASSNNRWTWWGEAWQVFEERPLAGAGAASFGVARRPIRRNESVVGEPHNTVLQFLAELGIVGLALALAAVAAGTLAARRTLRRAAAAERPAVLALVLAAAAYGLHALVDYDWDFLAVTGPALLVLGCLVAAGRGTVTLRRRPIAAAGIAVVAIAGLYSIGAPWLSERRAAQSAAALGTDPAAAARRAESAHRLNPLATTPLYYWALAEGARGDDRAALRRYEQAVELQPENWETWYLLGAFELDSGRFERACYALDLAYRLDPRGPAGRPGGLLDQVKRRLPGCPA